MGPVAARRMFSGSGLFCDGLMFALVINDVLYLKVDDASRGQFVAERMGPFLYTARGRSVALNYWRAPERLLDEQDELAAWSRTALGVARMAAASKVKKPRIPKPAKAVPAKRPKDSKPKGRKQTNT
jgi:DNA transformation protein